MNSNTRTSYRRGAGRCIRAGSRRRRSLTLPISSTCTSECSMRPGDGRGDSARLPGRLVSNPIASPLISQLCSATPNTGSITECIRRTRSRCGFITAWYSSTHSRMATAGTRGWRRTSWLSSWANRLFLGAPRRASPRSFGKTTSKPCARLITRISRRFFGLLDQGSYNVRGRPARDDVLPIGRNSASVAQGAHIRE